MNKNTIWIFLSGTFEQINQRLNLRTGHFMPPSLLKSQIDTIEEPNNALKVDINLSPDEIIKMIKGNLFHKSEFGLIGLGVMGKSLSRNIARQGFNISLFNRHVEGIEENIAIDFVAKHKELSNAYPFDDVELFVSSLQVPRKIMLMVKAGATVDYVIEDLLPHLSEGDIIVDGGNSHYEKTKQRAEYLKSKNISYIGVGVSGGEEGALKGPSIMPGGELKAYNLVRPYLESISAKDIGGNPCCSYIGPAGSGHFVKMVHNGIEYAEMQLLCEVYGILINQGVDHMTIASILESWKGEVNSYLLEITIDILRKQEGECALLEKILDKAGNKGTGNWTVIASAQLGVPSTLISAALNARYTSFYKAERIKRSKEYSDIKSNSVSVSQDDLLKAYKFGRIINHYQGFKLLSEASKEFHWKLNLSEIARVWTNGCIIRSKLMKELVGILKGSEGILSHKKFISDIQAIKLIVDNVVANCVLNRNPIPCLSEAVNFFNALITANSTANLIQAQRDYFGAHTYQRIDDDESKRHHTIWK